MQQPAEVQQQTEPATAVETQPSVAQPSPVLSSANADVRRAAACARNILQAERTILAASNKLLKTYVICPGLLYGKFSRLLVCAFLVYSCALLWQSR